MLIKNEVALRKYQLASELDRELITVMRYIPNGWPVNRKLCAGDTLLYYNLQHDLPMASGLVMYGSKVVIPYSPRGHVTGLLHAAYQGENKTLQRAQNSIYMGFLREVGN